MNKLIIALICMLCTCSLTAQVKEVIEVNETQQLRVKRVNADGTKTYELRFPDVETAALALENKQLIADQAQTISTLNKLITLLSQRVADLELQVSTGLGPVETITATSYTVTQADAGKHLIFTANTAITVNLAQVPAGVKCSIGTRGKGLIQFNGKLTSRAAMTRSQAGGTVFIIGEGNGLTAITGDLQR